MRETYGRVHALAATVTELGAGALLVLGRPPSRPTSPAFRRAAPMQRIQIKVKRPHPTSLPDLDLRTPSGRQLPY